MNELQLIRAATLIDYRKHLPDYSHYCRVADHLAVPFDGARFTEEYLHF